MSENENAAPRPEGDERLDPEGLEAAAKALYWHENEVWEYPHEWSVYRFMFTDGKIQDVRAIHDDSDVRGWVIERMRDRLDVVDKKNYRIEGVSYPDV